MNTLYHVALLSPVELTTHMVNNLTATLRPGMGIPIWNLKDSLANAYKILTRDPEILRRIKGLADIGASFGHEARPGLLASILGERLGERLRVQQYDLTAYVNRFSSAFIDVMQKAVRVQLEDAFDRMVAKGLLKSGQANKRDFINQAVGNYNSQASNRVAQFLKDTGLQGFATAAHTFTTQSVKTATGGAINAPATSTRAALELHARALAKLVPFLAAPVASNVLFWGEPFPQGVPVFAAKTGTDDDGRPRYFDPLAFTGLRRGWRATGQNALIEGLVQGKSRGQILDQAIRDLVHAGEHAVAGPPVQLLHTAVTGRDALGRQVAPQVSTARTEKGKAKAEAEGRPPAGSSQAWENLKAAAANSNPLLGQALGFVPRNRRMEPWRNKATELLGPFATKAGWKPPEPRSTGTRPRSRGLRAVQPIR
jgi:hypothetical protein